MEHVTIPGNQCHSPFRWVFADAAARAAQPVSACDVGHLGRQQSDGSFWVLTADTPPSWQTAGAAVVGSISGASDYTGTPTDGQVLAWNAGLAKWNPATAASGVADHGALTGLGDDDHPQYFDAARGDARWAALSHSHAGAYLPVSAAGLVEAWPGEIESPADGAYTLILDAPYALSIDSLAVETASGTASCSVQIGGVDVAGLSAVSAGTVKTTATASGGNSVAVGGRITLVLSSVAAAANLRFVLKTTRA